MPRKQGPKKYATGSSTVSRKTRALRGATGLANKQEEQATALLKQLAYDMHGGDWAGITDSDRAALCRKVAATMRKGGVRVSANQVRTVSQRMRSTPEVRTAYPVDLEPEEYAYIAYLHETEGRTMKGIVSAIIRDHRGQQACAC